MSSLFLGSIRVKYVLFLLKSTLNAIFKYISPEQDIFKACPFWVNCNKTKNSAKNKQVLSEIHSVKTFSIRKQLFDLIDIELEITESEIE